MAQDPGRVFPASAWPVISAMSQRTTQNLEVVRVDVERQLCWSRALCLVPRAVM
jgi:large subunit ribosomal protein L3